MSPWRTRLARGEVAPHSVAGVVRGVRASLRATHAVEALLFFVAGAFLVRGATLLSSAAEPDPHEAWGLALLGGVLCAACWWLEHPVRVLDTARALDRRLRHHGALLTAFEIEERGPARPLTAMEELLRTRVLARLRPREALAALFPPLLLPVAAPTLAALALLLVVDARRAPRVETVDFAHLAEGLEQALAAGALGAPGASAPGAPGADSAPGLSDEDARALAGLLRARASLPRSEEAWRRDPEGVEARLEALDRRVADLSAHVGEGELRRHLTEARTWLDALRMGLAAGVPGAPGADSGAGTGPGQGTAGTLEGTISRPDSAGDPTPMPPEPSAAPPGAHLAPRAGALGLQAGPWWPAEYDGVVNGWIERTRAARAAGAADR